MDLVKDCPFCGSKSDLCNYGYSISIECLNPNCKATMFYEKSLNESDKIELIEQWNKRA